MQANPFLRASHGGGLPLHRERSQEAGNDMLTSSRAPLFLTLLLLVLGLGLAGPAAAQVDGALVTGIDMPASLACGQTYPASITMKNVGSSTWTRDLPGGGYKLGAIDDQDPFRADYRVWLPEGVTVGPGQSYVFDFTMTAPQNEGNYFTDWRMVREWVGWFGTTASRWVSVTCQDVDASQIVSVNMPSTLSCGQTYNASITMKNVGTTPWTRDLPGGGFKLAAVGSNDPFVNPNARVWLPTGTTVAPGQNHTFNFTMTAPQQGGTYQSQWRMVRELVAFFGPIVDRSVQVSCQDVDDSQVVGVNIPSALSCGQTTSVSVTMKNIGTSTWTRAAGFKLGANDDSDPFTTNTRKWLPAGVSVAPGQNYTFTFNLTAPNQSGTYLTDWRMVHEGVAWFGAVAARNVVVSCQDLDDSQVVAVNIPTALTCGDTTNVSVTMKNTGTSTWTRAGIFKLGANNDSDPFTTNTRKWLPAGVSVAPGQNFTFSFNLTAPNQSGSYLTDWRMVHEGVAWFGQVAAQTVNVSCGATDDAQVISSVLPSALDCGETFNASVTVRNTGTSTWTRAAGFKLGAVGDSDPLAASHRVLLPAGVQVQPNQSHTFSFTLTAPQSGGNYLTDWRMVHEGVAFFGQTAQSNVNVSCQATNGAQILSSNLPSALGCGDIYPASVTVRNTGTTTWTLGSGYGLRPPSGSDPFHTQGFIGLPPGIAISPGEDYTFQFPLTAPQQGGNYNTTWRMSRSGGIFFGGTATSTVAVSCQQGSDASQVVASNLPASLDCGATYSASVTMKNIGTTTWTRNLPSGGYKLGAVGDSDPFVTNTRVWLPTGVTVAPGQQHTFSFVLTAPSQGGTYVTDWRMVREGVAFFGPTAISVVNVSCQQQYGARLSAASFPSALDCDEVAQASVTMQNTGTTTWTRDLPGGGYKLAAVDGSDPFTTATRVWLPSGVTVAPGAYYTFNLDLTAPSESGTYRTDWQMVLENVTFFGDVAAQNIAVSCGGGSADDADVDAFTLPATVSCGDGFNGILTVENTGTTTWTPAGGYAVAPTNSTDPFYTGPPIALQGANVPPGGLHTFTLPLVAPNTGGSATTAWRMLNGAGSGFGEVAQGSISVQCTSGSEPVIDSIAPTHISNGSVTVVTLAGQNFQGASVSIAAEPAEPGDPVPDFFPNVSVVSINGAGTVMDVQVDASDPRVSGFYNLVVANSAGEMGTVFRVVPSGPDVDVWTPSEPVRGRVYNLLISGVNLNGASVSTTAAGLSIFGLTSTSKYVYGFLEVSDTAALGFAEYVITSANGGQTRVPIQVQATSSASATKNDFNVTAEAAARAAQIGELVPEVYFQDLQIRTDVASPSSSTSESTRGPFCFFSLGWDIYRWSYVLAIPFDPLTGDIDRQVLAGIGLGQVVPAGIKIFSAFADFGINFQFSCFPISHIQICVYGFIGFEIPGIGGQILVATGCFFGGSFVPGVFTTGILGTFSFGTTSGGACAGVQQLTFPGDGGSQRGDVTLNECCPDQLTVTTQGTAFAGTPYAINFQGADVPVADIEPDAATCPDPPACLHRGTHHNGTLEGDTSLVVGPGFYHFLGTDAAGTDDRSCVESTHDDIQTVGQFWVGTRMGVGDLSAVGGGNFPPHASHQNGLDVDVRYVRSDGVEGPFNFNADPAARYDQAETQELIDLFIAQGATAIFVDARANIVDATGVVQTDNGHFNHFHVRFPDPDGAGN